MMRRVLSVLLTVAVLCVFGITSASAVFDRETLFGSDPPVQSSLPDSAGLGKPYLSGMGDRPLNEVLPQGGASSGGISFWPEGSAVPADSAGSIPLYEISGSEKISAAGYDAEKNALALKMKDTGEVKVYLDVPEILYTNFLKSPIKDSFFTLAIDGRYTQSSAPGITQSSTNDRIIVSVIP